MGLLYAIFGLLFWLYFIGYIAMGFVQPISAIIRVLSVERSDSEYAIGLKKYIVSVVLYFLFLYGICKHGYADNLFPFIQLYLFVIPWGFSIWYTIHIRTWKKKIKNIKAFDTAMLLNAPHEDRLLLESYPKKRVKVDNTIFAKEKTIKEKQKTIIRSLPKITLAK